jgi:F0F1-type ATP synthase assembly protein I
MPPTSAKGGTDTDARKASAPRQQFFAAAGNMSWQLAIVVLVPIVGGYKLDQHYALTPLLTLVGFVLAMIGTGAVMWRQLQRFAPHITQADIDAAKKLRDSEEDDV